MLLEFFKELKTLIEKYEIKIKALEMEELKKEIELLKNKINRPFPKKDSLGLIDSRM